MGQPIQVETTQLGDVVIFGTDRSITGQDGGVYGSREQANTSTRFPAQLAVRLFDADDAVNHVFVASNQIVVRRDTKWSESHIAAATEVVENFFLYYPEAVSG